MRVEVEESRQDIVVIRQLDDLDVSKITTVQVGPHLEESSRPNHQATVGDCVI